MKFNEILEKANNLEIEILGVSDYFQDFQMKDSQEFQILGFSGFSNERFSGVSDEKSEIYSMKITLFSCTLRKKCDFIV